MKRNNLSRLRPGRGDAHDCGFRQAANQLQPRVQAVFGGVFDLSMPPVMSRESLPHQKLSEIVVSENIEEAPGY